jgi:hypothetical protein
MATYDTKDKCELCDAIRTIFAFIEKCLKEDDKVLIDVADSVTVDTIFTGPK